MAALHVVLALRLTAEQAPLIFQTTSTGLGLLLPPKPADERAEESVDQSTWRDLTEFSDALPDYALPVIFLLNPCSLFGEIGIAQIAFRISNITF